MSGREWMLGLVFGSVVLAGCGGAGAVEEGRVEPAAPAVAVSRPAERPARAGAEAPTTTGARVVSEPAAVTEPEPARPEVYEFQVTPRSKLTITYPPDLTPDQREIVDTYSLFQQGLWKALDPPNPAEPVLPAVMTDEFLANSRQLLSDWARAGKTSAGDALFHPLQPEIDGDVAVMWDCGLDKSVLYDQNGVVISPAGDGYRKYFHELHRSPSGWRVQASLGLVEACEP